MADMTAVEDLTTSQTFVARFEPHRVELTGYCYRMLGSPFEAEDAVQETFTRAWRGIDGFEGRSSLRTWLYRIATNVCFDALRGRQRRARPMDLGPATPSPDHPGDGLPEATWLEPIPDERVVRRFDDPADTVLARDSVRLAFVAALHHLPPKQRAVLILREVLRWQASEVADLLDTSVPAVNSALQRARATLSQQEVTSTDVYAPMDATQRSLLDRYVDAFERYDMDALTALLHEDAIQSMPPYALWLSGRDEIARWMLGPGAGCRGSRVIPTVANGAPAFGQYRPRGPGGAYEPWALQVIEPAGDRIAVMTFFLDTARWFPLFGLPETPAG